MPLTAKGDLFNVLLVYTTCQEFKIQYTCCSKIKILIEIQFCDIVNVQNNLFREEKIRVSGAVNAFSLTN